MLVNGAVWPYMVADRGQYMFRILDGCETRFLNLTIVNDATNELLPMTMVQTDGAYAPRALPILSLFAIPAARHSVLVDFSSFAPGTNFTIMNNAIAPFPGGKAPEGRQSMFMRIIVGENQGFQASVLPDILDPGLVPFPSLAKSSRPPTFLTLNNVRTSNANPQQLYVNNQKFVGPPQLFGKLLLFS